MTAAGTPCVAVPDAARVAAWEEAVHHVAQVLLAGGVALLPTDTVYGVAQAVAAVPGGPEGLFAVKRRDRAKTVPWILGDPADLHRYGSKLPAYAQALAERLWPGGLTLVVRASDEVPAPFRGADATVALRVPNAPFVCAVARACGGALACTSANTSGLPAPVSFDQVERRILDEVAIAVDGGLCAGGTASTIVRCTGERPEVLRSGAVAQAELDRVLGSF
jgi:L-threonylcarbamoyladenylate synthase